MVKLIVAKGSNNVIGKDNDLIWHLPADMRFFTQTTKGHIVVMGRRNWDSIPLKYRPLSDRINVVITRNDDFKDAGCNVFHSMEEALAHYKKTDVSRDIFIIGGGQIYNYALAQDLIDQMFVTHIDQEFEGDTWFPEIDPNKWQKELVMSHPKDEKNAHSFTVWKYTRK